MRFFSPVLLFLPLFTFAQIFDPTTEWFEDETFFNTEFVKENSIKSFHSNYSTKKDSEVIEENQKFIHSEFNEDGQLLKYIKASVWAGKVDSTIYAFSYDSANLVQTKDIVFSNMHYHFLYKYNNSNQLIEQIKFDISNLPTKVVSVKSFAYENVEANKLKKLFLNDLGKAYIEETKEFQDGKLVFRRLEYVVNSKYREENYIYRSGKLISKNTKGNIGEVYNISYNYSYLDNGSFDEINISENGKLLQKVAFVYNQPKIPKAMVVRKYLEKKIDIYEFRYTFY